MNIISNKINYNTLPSTILPYIDKQNRWSSHKQILLWLDSYPPGTRVLDIGTASGTLGRLCQGKQFEIFGIEPQPIWAKHAADYYREILVTDLEHAPDEFIKDFRVVIGADVLEHMPDPDNALHRLVKLQPTGSDFIISVPNIANLWVRLNLLFGKFNYTERGILDRTHLRFFTRLTFINLLQESGLRIQNLKVTPIPLDLVNPFFESNKIGIALLDILAWFSRIFPTLLGYQWVGLATKVNHDECS